MSLPEEVEVVESLEFSVVANLASDLATFRLATERQQAYRDLIAFLGSDGSERRIALRILDLLTDAGDSMFAHKHDAGIAAYLLALADVNSTWVASLADVVLNAPNAYWIRQIAESLSVKSLPVQEMFHEAASEVFSVEAKTLSSDQGILVSLWGPGDELNAVFTNVSFESLTRLDSQFLEPEALFASPPSYSTVARDTSESEVAA